MRRERIRLDEDDEQDELSDGGDYFVDQKSPLEFIPTSCTQLDCVIGGGWPLRRIVNIAGDEATGKTLLCIEASRNFLKKWPRGRVFYRESESSFDEDYAEAIGMPVDKVEFIRPEEFETVEDFYEDLQSCCTKIKRAGIPGLYILDSLDGLSDQDELKRDFDKGSFGAQKAKNMSKAFRMLASKVAEANMCLLIISQTRDYLSDTGRPGKSKSGGKAVNFYSSIILWLSHIETLMQTRNNIKRAWGIKVRCRCSKNKIALPYRQCNFVITFGAGVDDVESNIEWLEDIKELDSVVGVTRPTYDKRLAAMGDDQYWKEADRLAAAVKDRWRESDRQHLAGVRRRPD